MAKNTLNDYSSTASSNSDVGGIGIAGTNAASNMDDGLRELMSHIANWIAGTAPVKDTATFADPSDLTKEFRFDGGGITAGQTRVITIPDGDVTIAANPVTLDGTQTLTNKTLTSPTINTPTIVVNDASFSLRDNSDTTKIVQFQLSGLTTGITRTLTPPDASGTIALTSDIPAAAASVAVGTIVNYAGSSAPTGWLFCYGQNVSRTTYSALFTAISTTYGTGDGSTTFTLPDLRGRVIAGKDDMGGTSANRLTNQTGGLNGDTLGATGGVETHALTAAQIPDNSTTKSGTNGPDSGFASGNHTGTGSAHNNVQPTIILNSIVYTGV